MTVGDCWLLEGGTRRLKDESEEKQQQTAARHHLPDESAVSLFLVLMKCVKAPRRISESKHHFMTGVLRATYSNFIEVTTNESLPLTSLLQPLGIQGRILYYFEKKQRCPSLKERIQASPCYFHHPKTGVWVSHEELIEKSLGKEPESHRDRGRGITLVDPIRRERAATGAPTYRYENNYREYASTEVKYKALLLGMVTLVSV